MSSSSSSSFLPFAKKQQHKRLKLDPTVVYLDEFHEFQTLFLNHFCIVSETDKQKLDPSSSAFVPETIYKYVAFEPNDDETISKMLQLMKSPHVYYEYPLYDKDYSELNREYNRYDTKHQKKIVEKIFAAMKLNVEWKWNEKNEEKTIKIRTQNMTTTTKTTTTTTVYLLNHLQLAWHLFIVSKEFTEELYKSILLDVWNEQSLEEFEEKHQDIQNKRDEKLIQRLKKNMFENHMVIPLISDSNEWICFSSKYKNDWISTTMGFQNIWNYENGSIIQTRTETQTIVLPFNLLYLNKISDPFPITTKYTRRNNEVKILDLHELNVGAQWYPYYAGRSAFFYYRLNWFPALFNNDLIQLILSFVFLPCTRTMEIDKEHSIRLFTVSTIEKKWKIVQYTRPIKISKTYCKKDNDDDQDGKSKKRKSTMDQKDTDQEEDVAKTNNLENLQ
jgi:hypothetical protein